MNEFLNSVPMEYYSIFIFASAFMENVFPPYPGDSVIVFSGYLLASEKIGLVSLITAVMAGNLISAIIMYYFGVELISFVRKKIKMKFIQEILDLKHLTRTHDWFNKYGIMAVIFSRFSAGIRFFISIVAGMVKMNLILFISAFSIATAIWNMLLLYGGYTLGQNWEQLLGYIRLYSGLIAVIFVLVGLLYLLKSKFKRKSEII